MNNEVPIFLELFSGTMTMSKTAKEFGFRVFSIDIDEQLEPSLCADILELTAEQIVEHCGGKPAVIWASPDCTQWSFARGAKNEFSKAAKLKGKPLSEDAIHARNLIIKTLSLIEELDPHYFFVENPFHTPFTELSSINKKCGAFPSLMCITAAMTTPLRNIPGYGAISRRR